MGRIRSAWTLVAALALLVWSVFLLDTLYLEPLPARAGILGVVLLVVAAVGAGAVSGWRWPTALLFVPAGIGLFWLSDALVEPSVDPKVNDVVLLLLLLMPPGVVVGAVMSKLWRWGPRAGAVLLALPLIAVAWAAVRHIRPIDHQPTHPLLLEIRPDSHITTRDRRVQTAEGVGIGDNLALVKRIDRGDVECQYVYSSHAFEPACFWWVRIGKYLYDLEFEGDPIKEIAGDAVLVPDSNQ